MLLGLYGMFAVGKTTFLNENMDDFADIIPEDLNLSVVLADLADEYRFMKMTDQWQVIHDKPRWKGKRDEKLPYVADMIRDRRRLWIVESARYFGGLQHIFIEHFRKCKGGLKFIVFRSDPKTARKFLIERCEFRGKEYNDEYWTPQRLEYESSGRYINVVNNHYKPAGVECFVRPISYSRKEWSMVKDLINTIIKFGEDEWYYDKDMPDQGQQRVRQDHHRKAVTRILK